MIECYIKFINNLASRTFQMRTLLKTKVAFEWGKQCEKEFQDIKNCLKNAIKLGMFVSSWEQNHNHH